MSKKYLQGKTLTQVIQRAYGRELARCIRVRKGFWLAVVYV